MIPISAAAPGPAPAVREAEKSRETRPVSPASPQGGGPLKPARDEYVPEGEKKREPYGRYWLGKDQDGSLKVCFDDPEAKDAASPASPEAAAPPKAEEPEKDEEPGAPGKPAPPGRSGEEEKCTADTDEVDRELKRLREKREELARRLSSETGGERARALERKLAQVEGDLAQKDNDAYRRRHTKFTNG